MERIKETVAYYKSKFGADIFDEMGKDFVQSFKMVAEIYAYFHIDENEKDEKDALTDKNQCGVPWKKYPEVVIEMEGNQKEIAKETIVDLPQNLLMDGQEKAKTPKAILRIIETPYFMLDVLCDAIYEVKKEMGNFCNIDVKDSTVQADFIKFRRNGRKLIDEKIRQEINFFTDYGYPVPLNAKMVIEKGKRTQIEDVVPNIFRLLIIAPEFRKLYCIRELENYSLKNVIRIMEEQRMEVSVLEQWKLEDIMGVNLVSKLTAMIIQMTNGLTQKTIEEEILPDIKALLKVIIEGKGVYSKLQLADLLKDFILNAELKQASAELVKKRIVNWTEIMISFNKKMEYEYQFFKNLVLCMIYESTRVCNESKQKEKIIRYFEGSVTKIIKGNCEFKGKNYPILPNTLVIKNTYDSQQDFLYTLIQQEYMLLQVKKNK